MKTRTWKKPELVVLSRSKPEEMVLFVCKSGMMPDTGPNMADACCYATETCMMMCDAHSAT